jgi:hypothetical protein
MPDDGELCMAKGIVPKKVAERLVKLFVGIGGHRVNHFPIARYSLPQVPAQVFLRVFRPVHTNKIHFGYQRMVYNPDRKKIYRNHSQPAAQSKVSMRQKAEIQLSRGALLK